MKISVSQYQQWLNDRGARLVIDGKGGPATRAATIAVFTNRNAPAATAADLQRTAEKIGCTVAQVRAVAAVESSGSGFDNTGLLKCLWERHYFWKRIRVIIPGLSNPKGGGYTTDADRDGINDSWQRVAQAACRNPLAAFESASFGRFQVMGANAASIGYDPLPQREIIDTPNAIDFAYGLSRSEAAHYDSLARFVITNGLVGAMRRLSTNADGNRAFALGYNGPKGVVNGYHLKLARAMRA